MISDLKEGSYINMKRRAEERSMEGLGAKDLPKGREITTTKVDEKKIRGRPRRTWTDDIIECTGLKTYEMITIAEDRNRWKNYIHHASFRR